MFTNSTTRKSVAFASVLLFLLTLSSPLLAEDIKLDNFQGEAQSMFEKFVRDVGLGISYVPADPAESRGLIGFDIGAGVTAIELEDNKGYMQAGFENSDVPSTLILPKVRVDKGLPIGGDVGAFVSGDPDGNVRVFGAAYKHCLMEGGMLFPAVALRFNTTMLTGVDDLDLQTYGADVSISKGFEIPLILGVTPYAGAGLTRIEGSEDNSIIDFKDVSTTESKFFAGSRFSLGFINVVAEAEISEIKRYTLRANIGL